MNAFKGKRQLNIKSIIFYAVCAIFCITSCVLLFCTNVTHSVALEQEIRCGIEEHTHNDSCYNGDFLICDKPAHTHDGNCYIVLLKENDINNILTLLGNSESHSLENVIADTMSSALTFNANLNSADSGSSEAAPLSQDRVAELNNTISKEDELPDIVLNENINTVSALAVGDMEEKPQTNATTTFNIKVDPNNSNYYANFYLYLDGNWTCIGSLEFTTQRNGIRYDSVLPTADILKLVNDALGTAYAYNSFDIAVAASLSGSYSKTNIGMASVTTTIGYRQQTSTARATKYVRLIPEGGSATSTAFAFYTVEYIYPDGTTVTNYVRSGTTIKLPSGNYEWSDGNNTYSSEQAVTINKKITFEARLLGPPTYININYDVAFPTVSGVTISTKPTIS
ncbi:MAG: hypothetical protein J6A69_12645 [Clostridia bacterium]|nr:hypothetical protein [Clostridia bacterium]